MHMSQKLKPKTRQKEPKLGKQDMFSESWPRAKNKCFSRDGWGRQRGQRVGIVCNLVVHGSDMHMLQKLNPNNCQIVAKKSSNWPSGTGINLNTNKQNTCHDFPTEKSIRHRITSLQKLKQALECIQYKKTENKQENIHTKAPDRCQCMTNSAEIRQQKKRATNLVTTTPKTLALVPFKNARQKNNH